MQQNRIDYASMEKLLFLKQPFLVYRSYSSWFAYFYVVLSSVLQISIIVAIVVNVGHGEGQTAEHAELGVRDGVGIAWNQELNCTSFSSELLTSLPFPTSP